MSIAEALYDRREFVSFFARKPRSGQHQNQPGPKIRSTPPKPPEHDSLRITRRKAIIGGSAVAVGAIGIAASIIKPWEFFYQETLESLVAQAKRMEDEYQDINLSDKEARNQYTKLLADVFINYYPLGISREQLLTSVIFVNSKETYEEIFVRLNQDPYFPPDYVKRVAAITPAFTSKTDGKIYISTTNAIFQKEITSDDPKFPKDWNPLKSLRLTLSHEFSHAISRPITDELIFSIVDSGNAITDKKILGFRIEGFNNREEFVGLYDAIDEASVELLSKYLNTDLFRSFVSEDSDLQGNNITAVVSRLGQLLDSASIDRIELARLHRVSNLRGFLLLLGKQYGLNPQKITEKDRILFGFSLFEALIQNNQAILQDYMNTARRLSK